MNKGCKDHEIPQRGCMECAVANQEAHPWGGDRRHVVFVGGCADGQTKEMQMPLLKHILMPRFPKGCDRTATESYYLYLHDGEPCYVSVEIAHSEARRILAERKLFKGVGSANCRGSLALGTGCGECERCENEPVGCELCGAHCNLGNFLDYLDASGNHKTLNVCDNCKNVDMRLSVKACLSEAKRTEPVKMWLAKDVDTVFGFHGHSLFRHEPVLNDAGQWRCVDEDGSGGARWPIADLFNLEPGEKMEILIQPNVSGQQRLTEPEQTERNQ